MLKSKPITGRVQHGLSDARLSATGAHMDSPRHGPPGEMTADARGKPPTGKTARGSRHFRGANATFPKKQY